MHVVLFHLAALYSAFRRSQVTKVEYNSIRRFAEAVFEASLGNSLYVRHIFLLSGNPDYNLYFKYAFLLFIVMFSVVCYYYSGRIAQLARKMDDKDVLISKLGVYVYYIFSILLIFILDIFI
ncbi:hypothetical protein DDR33_21800 [Pararcticibacter amylolyticus]|uniref:Uncharacterized protein n=1 Tax=Pararcticibacter amylolyticus TaxID=2173175 RepID=A0A2U2PAT0_9SPHI|nr:hypothetical protein DDR33_21800 [Pararcticibacter amylolyticus]